MTATERPFYDLAHDASESTRKLADVLRQTIEGFRKEHAEATEWEIRDALRLVSLDWGG
jgi:hypothetical protein